MQIRIGQVLERDGKLLEARSSPPDRPASLERLDAGVSPAAHQSSHTQARRIPQVLKSDHAHGQGRAGGVVQVEYRDLKTGVKRHEKLKPDDVVESAPPVLSWRNTRCTTVVGAGNKFLRGALPCPSQGRCSRKRTTHSCTKTRGS